MTTDDPAGTDLLGRVLTRSQLAEYDATRPRQWGPWRLDPHLCVLYPSDPYRYEIDLETCTSSAKVLDWICQIATKDWAGDDATLAGLVRALADVLNPQATLCGSGIDKRMTKAAIRKHVRGVAATTPTATPETAREQQPSDDERNQP